MDDFEDEFLGDLFEGILDVIDVIPGPVLAGMALFVIVALVVFYFMQ